MKSRTIGRRDFLANAALAGAGLAIGPSVWAAERQRAMTSVGCGKIAEA
jgi:hypothetical protein